MSDAIAATANTGKGAANKYTHTQLNQLKIDELRKTYRAVIPHSERNSEKHTKAEYATRDFMIDAILKR